MNFNLRRTARFYSSGFSLIELLVVIILIGLLATLSFASFDWKGPVAVSSLENMRSFLESVRRASLRGQACTVTVSTLNLRDGSTVLSVSPSADNVCGLPSAHQLESSKNEYYLLTLTSGGSPVTSFTFTPRGTIFNSNTTPSFSNDLIFNLRLADKNFTPKSKSYCLRMSSMLGTIEGIGKSSC